MNRVLSLLSVSLLLAACGGGGTREVELRIEGAAGRTAYFDRFENGRPFHVDSVKLDNSGAGTLNVPALPLDFYRITVGDEQLVVALDSAESVLVEAAVGNLAAPTSVKGSQHSEAYHGFLAETRAYEAKRDDLRKRISTEPTNADLVDSLNTLNGTFHARCVSFTKENSSSPAALAAVNRLNIQQELALFKQVRDDMRKTMPKSGFYAQFRQGVDQLEQQEIAIKLQEEEAKRVANMLPIGGVAPEIRQQTPDGGTFALSDLRGKYVLIDFWASWCRPCRMENPNVKRVYDKYHRKGFEILGVSLDRDQGAWVQAIQADGLPWKHVSDLGFWSNAAAQEYGVTSIPFTVLVDKEGKVLEKGLRAAELEVALAKLFGS
ncbi:MAG: TlpA disulfide reductase family protein [Flavobacteriales bacterium]